ncbi:MAG: DUF1043 family protein [Endozoicomonas sp. (ex Botrylloides leachii)]|nr:DUF1043 family protein [Endozoicomonas sp. (ex Botrylloides leachii)]
MENVYLLWLIGCLAFLGGALCGAVLYHIFMGSKYHNSKLAEQLDELQHEFVSYKEKVADHFTSTAQLANKMTEAYKDVHEHMANSADTLCQDEHIKNQMSDLLLGSNTLLSGKILKRKTPSITSVEQPKDYAPKNKSGDKGTLAEDFGLEQNKEVASN